MQSVRTEMEKRSISAQYSGEKGKAEGDGKGARTVKARGARTMEGRFYERKWRSTCGKGVGQCGRITRAGVASASPHQQKKE